MQVTQINKHPLLIYVARRDVVRARRQRCGVVSSQRDRSSFRTESLRCGEIRTRIRRPTLADLARHHLGGVVFLGGFIPQKNAGNLLNSGNPDRDADELDVPVASDG